MDGYKSVEFEKLSEEEIRFFQTEFIAVMEKMKTQIDEIEETRRNALGKERKVDNLHVSKFGKLLLIAKKILVNTAISHFTGIDPVFLDNDCEFLRINQTQRNHYYKHCDIAALAYSISKDLKDGLDTFLDKLKQDDINQLIPLFKSIQDTYIGGYQVMNVGATSFEPVLYRIFDRANIIDDDKFQKYAAMYNRGYMLQVPYNIIKGIDDVYHKYENVYGAIKVK